MDSWWREVVTEAAARWGTPIFVCAWEPVEAAVGELTTVGGPLPVRNWLSVKTHPVKQLLQEWKRMGWGVEVVSEFEYRAALAEGFTGQELLVNGVAKHRWLGRWSVPSLRVHFDSLTEVNELLPTAARDGWHVGLRLHLSLERDPDDPNYGGQFGMSEREAAEAARLLSGHSIQIESVHFHLGTNLDDLALYAEALEEAAGICRRLGLRPRFVDCGGGLPAPGEAAIGSEIRKEPVDLTAFRNALLGAGRLFPDCSELWLENGRFVSARSGVLAVRVVDIKDRPESRYLICDGGRTNQALPSDWEKHDVATVPTRTAQKVHSTICGPTCMMYDRLARLGLPDDLGVGDLIVWTNAGAYHIPWETQFSHGLAAVAWVGRDGVLQLARPAQAFEQWWGRWS